MYCLSMKQNETAPDCSRTIFSHKNPDLRATEAYPDSGHLSSEAYNPHLYRSTAGQRACPHCHTAAAKLSMCVKSPQCGLYTSLERTMMEFHLRCKPAPPARYDLRSTLWPPVFHTRPPHDATCATRTAFNCRENHAGGENGYTYESLTTGLTNLIMS
jgi:hypothetical protein